MDSKVLELGQINFEIDKESDKLMPSKTLFGDLTVLTSVHPSHFCKKLTGRLNDTVHPLLVAEENPCDLQQISWVTGEAIEAFFIEACHVPTSAVFPSD